MTQNGIGQLLVELAMLPIVTRAGEIVVMMLPACIPPVSSSHHQPYASECHQPLITLLQV